MVSSTIEIARLRLVLRRFLYPPRNRIAMNEAASHDSTSRHYTGACPATISRDRKTVPDLELLARLPPFADDECRRSARQGSLRGYGCFWSLILIPLLLCIVTGLRVLYYLHTSTGVRSTAQIVTRQPVFSHVVPSLNSGKIVVKILTRWSCSQRQ